MKSNSLNLLSILMIKTMYFKINDQLCQRLMYQ